MVDRFSTERMAPVVAVSSANSSARFDDTASFRGRFKSGGATPPLGLYSDATDWPTELNSPANPALSESETTEANPPFPDPPDTPA